VKEKNEAQEMRTPGLLAFPKQLERRNDVTEFTAKFTKAQDIEQDESNEQGIEMNEATEKEERNMQTENNDQSEQNTTSTEQVQSIEGIEAQLEAEGLGVLDGSALLPGGAEGQDKALYLGAPVSAGESEGMDVSDVPEEEQDEQGEQDKAEYIESNPETCPVLSGPHPRARWGGHALGDGNLRRSQRGPDHRWGLCP
jgi:hypothetical protein